MTSNREMHFISTENKPPKFLRSFFYVFTKKGLLQQTPSFIHAV